MNIKPSLEGKLSVRVTSPPCGSNQADGTPGRQPPNLSRQLITIEAGQADIENTEIGHPTGETLQGSHTIACGFDIKPVTSQQIAEYLADIGTILDQRIFVACVSGISSGSTASRLEASVVSKLSRRDCSPIAEPAACGWLSISLANRPSSGSSPVNVTLNGKQTVEQLPIPGPRLAAVIVP